VSHEPKKHAGQWLGSDDRDLLLDQASSTFAGHGLGNIYTTAVEDDFVFESTSGSSAAASTTTAPIANHVFQRTDSPSTIDHPGKIGIGTWDIDAKSTALADLGRFDFGWHYNWKPDPLWSANGNGDSNGFVPMIWGKGDVRAANLRAASDASSKFLLGFNEPDSPSQSNLTVNQALQLWPELMSTGKILGSPATTTGQTLGQNSWLHRFMDKAEAQNCDVDFVAVHYYSDDRSIAAFEDFLRDVHQEYDKPVWVTEWALVDWNKPDRFTSRELADFAHDAMLMMDDLNFVKRHAWFGAYDGGDGWDINTELINDSGKLTAVGETFADLTL
jgi:hypothetical protein